MASLKKVFKGLGKIGHSAAKTLQTRFANQLNQLNKMAKRITQMGRYAARYSASYINQQLKKLKKMQKNIHKSMKKAAKQTKRFIQKKAKQARVLKKRIADKVKKANSWAYRGLKEGAKRLGKAVEVSADWVKSQKSNFLKGADVVGDFLGIKDAYILVTGKDWHGNKRSRVEAGAWLIAGFTTMGKAAKAGKMAVKGVKSTKAAKSVGRKVKSSSAGKTIKNSYNRGKQLKSKFKQKASNRKANKKVPVKQKPIIQRGWVFLQQTLPNGVVKIFKQPVEFVKNLGFKKVAPTTGNRAQRRAAQKKGHAGSKKNKDKLNKQRQKQNKAAKQQRKNTKNAKSKNWNSTTKKAQFKTREAKIQYRIKHKKPLAKSEISTIQKNKLNSHQQKMLEEYESRGWKGQVPGGPKKAGKNYRNDPPNPGMMKLPTHTSKGKKITYREFDINNVTPRDKQRFILGSDGSVYFTNDHYITFKRIP